MKEKQTTTHHGFLLIVVLLVMTYGLGVLMALGGLLGHQNLDPAVWRPDTISYFVPVFALGFISAAGVLGGKKWGVYGLVATWLLTGFVNLLVGPPYPAYSLTVWGVLLVVLFFMFLLPVWPELE